MSQVFFRSPLLASNPRKYGEFKYHFRNEFGRCACGIAYVDDATGVDWKEISPSERCTRSGCRQRWEKLDLVEFSHEENNGYT